MWAKLNPEGTLIEELIAHPKPIEVYGIKYPRQIFKWSAEMLKEIHIVPVVTEGQSLDNKYYIEVDESYTVALDGNSVVKTIGVKAADRVLEDVAAVDEAGAPFLDDHGNQLVTPGLKSNALSKLDQDAYSRIVGFDWLQVRRGSTAQVVPSEVVEYLIKVRAAHSSIKAAIKACTTLEEFKALYVDIRNDEGVVTTTAKINDWPDDYNIKSMWRGS
jgi:hypothetical protein